MLALMNINMLTKIQRQVLIELAGNKCQYCVNTENLEIHRIVRGNAGGKYIANNLLVLCNRCHKKVHEIEF